MSNNKARITTKQEEQRSTSTNEAWRAMNKHGGMWKWGQVGPFLQKNGKLICEASTKGVKETVERLHRPEPKVKT